MAHIYIAHRWQTQGPWAESSPAPCFIQPGTLFLPSGSAELSLNCYGIVTLYSPKTIFGPLKATSRLIWPPVKTSLTPLIERESATDHTWREHKTAAASVVSSISSVLIHGLHPLSPWLMASLSASVCPGPGLELCLQEPAIGFGPLSAFSV